MQFDEFGRELPDPTPVTRKININAKVSTLQEMRRMYHLIRHEAETQGFDTPEDADDFDIDDEVEPASPFEHDFDNVPVRELMDSPAVASGGPGPAPGPSSDAPGSGSGPSGGVPPVASPSPSPGTSQ